MTEKEALLAYSRGEMTAIELRQRLGGVSYGEILRRLNEEWLPLPHAPESGYEEDSARAHDWMFPRGQRS